MAYRDLRDFISQLEARGELRRVQTEVSPNLEMTALCDRVLRSGGPAILFEKPAGHSIPVLGNLFGSTRRVALAMGANPDLDTNQELRRIGTLLASLKEPDPPQGVRDVLQRWVPILLQVRNMASREVAHAPCQEMVWEAEEVDLARLPVQTCWPGDVSALITWGLVVTRAPEDSAKRPGRQNLGIYRQQVLGAHKLIMRWLPHRGGALDYRAHCAAHPGAPFPMAVVLGADPATMLAAVTPIPDACCVAKKRNWCAASARACRCRRARKSCWKG
jgi:4-hydroxy-3-polyprenylbenzoate decarboxylase